MKKRIYADGVPQHVYAKGIDGCVIFYNVMDTIYFITLYYCLSKKHGIITTAFGVMPNHFHAQQNAGSRPAFSSFNQELISKFVLGYNRWHDRAGALFEPYGSVPKLVAKTIRNNISYINNNGPVGRLSSGVLDYKWNLLSFFKSKNTDDSQCSKAYKKAVKLTDYHQKHLDPLPYETQVRLYSHLAAEEKNMLIDHILEKYTVIDYAAMIRYYGSYEKAILAMDANCGSEPEMQEDWEDYSVYREMIRIIGSKGIDTQHLNFEAMDPDTLACLARELACIPKATAKQVRRFLHIPTVQK